MAYTKDANGMIDIDAPQVIRTATDILDDGTIAQRVINVGGQLVPKVYDGIDLSYIVSGPGIGEIGTVVYKLGVATVATLTLSYDGSNRLTSVVKS